MNVHLHDALETFALPKSDYYAVKGEVLILYFLDDGLVLESYY